MQRTRTTFLILAVMLCIGAIGYGAYALRSTVRVSGGGTDAYVPASGFASADASTTVALVAGPRAVPAGSQEYRNDQYYFSLLYPNMLTVKSYDEGGGASTVTFQDVASAQGLQIFIVPYTAPQVSVARFRQDEPSGVLQSPLAVTVGGVPATSFYSTDAALGDTAEVWLIYKGYLYEVTAPKSEAQWLSQILSTWEFTQ
jgi:hypothetical protein